MQLLIFQCIRNIWVTGMCATIHDIKEADELFVQTLQAMKDIDNAGVDESNFNEV